MHGPGLLMVCRGDSGAKNFPENQPQTVFFDSDRAPGPRVTC